VIYLSSNAAYRKSALPVGRLWHSTKRVGTGIIVLGSFDAWFKQARRPQKITVNSTKTESCRIARSRNARISIGRP